MIEKIQGILKDSQCQEIQGVFIDIQSANLINMIYELQDVKGKEKLNKALEKNIQGVVSWAWSKIK